MRRAIGDEMKTLLAILAVLIIATPAISQEIIGCEHHLQVYDLDYCRTDRCGPCYEGEGDCDTDNECAEGLVCNQVIGIDTCVYPTLNHKCTEGTRPVVEVLSADEINVTCTGR